MSKVNNKDGSSRVLWRWRKVVYFLFGSKVHRKDHNKDLGLFFFLVFDIEVLNIMNIFLSLKAYWYATSTLSIENQSSSGVYKKLDP